VKNGLIKKQVLDAIELDNVQVEGKKAFATLRNQGKPVNDLVFEFELHEGTWKLDLKKVLNQAEHAWAELRQKANKSKIELSIFLLERTYKQDIPSQILNGPLK